jgi:hypothetical protein
VELGGARVNAIKEQGSGAGARVRSKGQVLRSKGHPLAESVNRGERNTRSQGQGVRVKS